MSKPITQAEMDEISAYCKTHPNCRVQLTAESWCMFISDGKNYMGWMHPRTFLDMIRETPQPTTDILKTT